VKAEILRRLLESHVAGDDQGFRKAALQLAATEGDAGHTRIADELRAIIARMPVTSHARTSVAAVDIAQPRGDLAGLLTGGYRQERLKDIILPTGAHQRLERLLREHSHRENLEAWGVGSSRKLLFHGPPGCGKTLAASVIAGELGMPLMTVRFDGLFSRYLGATAGHLKVIFDEMPRRPAVYLFDEFDAVGKSRGDSHEVGEIRRVVTSFLQLMDADQSGSIIIAATNFEELLDRAVFRRFDVLIRFTLPTVEQLDRLIRLRLRMFVLSPRVVQAAARAAGGLSFADAARACDDAIRTMVLEDRVELAEDDLTRAFAVATARLSPSGDPGQRTNADAGPSEA
jgi:SpoVK/Ycf46/Vps4 family AAA+-type ATPase